MVLCSSEQTGQQRNKGGANQRHPAACHQLFYPQLGVKLCSMAGGKMEVAERISQAIRNKTKARAFVQQQSSFGGRRGSMPVQKKEAVSK